jgi:microcystin-dependent protein
MPDRILARSSNAAAYQTNTSGNLQMMAPQALALAGGGLPHNNMQPYLTLNFCIALQGIFPQRP